MPFPSGSYKKRKNALRKKHYGAAPPPRSTKRFHRSNWNPRRQIMTTVLPQHQYAKLKWSFPLNYVTLNNDSSTDLIVLANGFCPTGQLSNPTAYPTVTVGTNVIEAGTPVWSGMESFNTIYQRMIVIGASIKITLLGDQTGAVSSFTHVQHVLTKWVNDDQSDFGDINNLTTQELMSQKNAKTKTLTSSGGANKIIFKDKATTSYMLGLKDIYDDNEAYCKLETNFACNDNPAIVREDVMLAPVPTKHWYWHLRSQSGNTSSEHGYHIEMTCNVRFSNPRIYKQPKTIAAPPPPPPA